MKFNYLNGDDVSLKNTQRVGGNGKNQMHDEEAKLSIINMYLNVPKVISCRQEIG